MHGLQTEWESVVLNFHVDIRFFVMISQGIDDMLLLQQDAPAEHNQCTSVFCMYRRIELLPSRIDCLILF